MINGRGCLELSLQLKDLFTRLDKIHVPNLDSNEILSQLVANDLVLCLVNVSEVDVLSLQ